MIVSFSDKETEKIWKGQRSRKFPGDIQNRALNKLRLIDAAKSLEERSRPAIDWKSLAVLARASGKSGLTTSGAFVFGGTVMLIR